MAQLKGNLMPAGETQVRMLLHRKLGKFCHGMLPHIQLHIMCEITFIELSVNLNETYFII